MKPKDFNPMHPKRRKDIVRKCHTYGIYLYIGGSKTWQLHDCVEGYHNARAAFKRHCKKNPGELFTLVNITKRKQQRIARVPQAGETWL